MKNSSHQSQRRLAATNSAKSERAIPSPPKTALALLLTILHTFIKLGPKLQAKSHSWQPNWWPSFTLLSAIVGLFWSQATSTLNAQEKLITSQANQLTLKISRQIGKQISKRGESILDNNNATTVDSPKAEKANIRQYKRITWAKQTQQNISDLLIIRRDFLERQAIQKKNNANQDIHNYIIKIQTAHRHLPFGKELSKFGNSSKRRVFFALVGKWQSEGG